MATLIFTYSPKEDVSHKEFKKFLDEVDQPATMVLPSTISARILRVLDEESNFRYIELLEVTSFEDWDRDTESPSPELQKVLDMWPDYAEMDEMKIYRCQEI